MTATIYPICPVCRSRLDRVTEAEHNGVVARHIQIEHPDVYAKAHAIVAVMDVQQQELNHLVGKLGWHRVWFRKALKEKRPIVEVSK